MCIDLIGNAKASLESEEFLSIDTRIIYTYVERKRGEKRASKKKNLPTGGVKRRRESVSDHPPLPYHSPLPSLILIS